MPGESASTPLKSSSVEFIDPKDASTGRGSRAASTRVPSAAAKASSEVQPRSAPHQQSPSRTTQPESAAAGDDVSPFESVLRGVEMAYDALVDTKRGLSTTAVLNKIYFAYSFPQYRDGTVGSFKLPVQEVLHYNASALLETLEKRKYENYEFYSYLEQLSTAELRLVAYKPSDFPVKLMPRKRYIRQSKKDIQPASATALPVTVRKAETPDSARLEDVPIAGRGKSLKREGRRTGRKSFLRPVVTNKKRPHSQLESDSETEAQVEAAEVTNSHYFSDGDDTMEDAPDVETPQDGDASDSGQPTPYQEKPVQIVIRAEKIPSTTPQGPDATWTCDQDDCGYVVRGGDDEECQARIREHFVDHEQQVERVSLAVTESRGHLPIKYAFFPPFLIIVLLIPPPHRRRSSSMSVHVPPPDLSRPAREAFHDLVQQFRRRPRPVSDRINLTCLQSSAREDQAHGREVAGPAADHGRHSGASADQTESDSVTVAGD